MFGNILAFELRYQLRRPSFLVSLLGAMLLVFLIITGVAERAGDSAAVLKLNAPIAAARLLAAFSIFTLLIPLVIFGRAALRDAETGMEELVRATPTSLLALIAARFIAAFVLVALIYATAIPSAELALHMPWVDSAMVGPFRVDSYLRTYAALLVPNILIFGAAAFAVTSWTRSMASAYVLFMLFIGLLVIASTSALKTTTVGAMLDPFGLTALAHTTRYWANVQHDTSALPVEGVFLWNRLAWGGLAALLIASTALFLPRAVKGGRPQVEERLAPPRAAEHSLAAPLRPGGATPVHQLAARLRYETASAMRGWTFAAMLILLVASVIGMLQFPDPNASLPFLPVTITIAPTVTEVAALSGLLMVILLAGEAMWRERAARVSEILDATPVSNAVLFCGKLGALLLLTVVYLLVATAIGAGVQLWRGASSIDFGIYALHGLIDIVLPLIMYAVLTMFLHTLVPNKYVGHLAVLGVIAALITGYVLGIEDGLLQFASIPQLPASAMDDPGQYVGAALWFAAYWGGISLLIAVAAQLLWARGLRTSLADRLRAAPSRLGPATGAASLVAVLVAAVAGGVIYWNTHILNPFVTQNGIEQMRADYERTYSAELSKPQPRIAEIDMAVDLDPANRLLSAKGTYRLVNRSAGLIDTVRVQFDDEVKVAQVGLERSALIAREPRFNDYLFRPENSLAPGESLTLDFTLGWSAAGFRHGEKSAEINTNGTFITQSTFAPWIGVMSRAFVTDQVRRRKLGLPALERVEQNGLLDENRNFLSGDSDFVRFGMTLSTSLDQIAIAPGSLKSQWVKGGRAYYRYEADQPIANFWSILSARYAVSRSAWKGIDLAVHYDPAQGQNVPRMLSAMKQALDYYTRTFGPFQHSQLRIAEYPYGAMAQSFPATISYAEAMGFMLDPSRDGIDYIGFVTAHEVAHQWWGHQAVPADMPGAQLLSETLAEYSALMVMERIHGRDGIRPYLKADLDHYLSRRGMGDIEQPLSGVRLHQAHIAYKKGALAMYAIKDAIGQEAMDRALRRYLERFRNSSAPYPSAHDFLSILREEAGPDHQMLITDLFETITLWDFKAVHAYAAPAEGGKWKVNVLVSGEKFHADEVGAEQPGGLDDDVDIGLFDEAPSAAHFGPSDVIALEKRRLVGNGMMSYEFITERRPTVAAVNPYLKLIERNWGDNVIPVIYHSGS